MARQNVTATHVLRMFGGVPTNDPVNFAQGMSEPRNATVPEVLVAGTVYRRVFHGPKIGGHWTLQVFVDAAGGAASGMTIAFSNHPDPDIATDADWTDSGVTAVDLTTTTPKFVTRTDDFPEWIMLRAAPLVTGASIRAFVRTEGGSVPFEN